MSEYQHYEFRAVDKPLTAEQLKRLRNLSTRAAISSTSFVNTYQWGDFKGDPSRLMEKMRSGCSSICAIWRFGTSENPISVSAFAPFATNTPTGPVSNAGSTKPACPTTGSRGYRSSRTDAPSV